MLVGFCDRCGIRPQCCGTS